MEQIKFDCAKTAEEKYTSREKKYIQWTVSTKTDNRLARKKEGVALLCIGIAKDLELDDCDDEKDCQKFTKQKVYASAMFVRWIKQPPGVVLLTEFLYGKKFAFHSHLAKVIVKVPVESPHEPLHIECLMNDVKACASHAKQFTRRQSQFFDNLATALLKTIIEDCTTDHNRLVSLTASGGLAKNDYYDIPALVRYYEKLGFQKIRASDPHTNDGDGVDMTATVGSFLENADRIIDGRCKVFIE